MKKTLFCAMAAVLTAGAFFTSCNTIEPETASKTIEMTVNATAPDEISDAKVAFGGLSGGKYSLLWTINEQIRIFENNGEAWGANTKSSSITVSADKKTATASFSIAERSGSSFSYWLAYPGGANNWQISGSDNKNYLKMVRQGMTKTGVQTPTATGIDKNYVLMIADGGTYSSQPTSLGNVQFKYTGSFGKLTVKNLPALESGVSISNLRITFNDKTDVTGFLDYYTETDEVKLVHSNSQSVNYIDINPKNIAVNTTAFDIWFGILPITAAAGEKVTFTFTMSDSSTKEKVVTIPEGKPLEFARGRITGFSVNMATAAAASKTLTFDLTQNTDQLPTDKKSRTGIGALATFTLTADDGNTYTFNNAGGLYHGTDKDCSFLAYSSDSDNGYVGLPAIPGYKLVSVAITRKNAGARYVQITSASPIGDTTPLTGEGEVTWSSTTPTPIVLTGTSANTMYYLRSTRKDANLYVDIKTLILKYDPE